MLDTCNLEINRIRVSIFQCEFTREPLQIPDPVGEITVRQEKVFVPVQQYPEVSEALRTNL